MVWSPRAIGDSMIVPNYTFMLSPRIRFFNRPAAQALSGTPEFVFIDGMHHFENAFSRWFEVFPFRHILPV